MVDYFTKWATARPIVQADAKSVAQEMWGGWIADHGVPYRIHTDRGTQFESYLLRELCHLLKIDRSRTTSYHPESNGQVERTNRTLKSLLRLQLERFEQNQWDVALPTCLLAYRAAVHASTGHTPAFLTYGREIRLAADVINEPPHAPGAHGRPCFVTETREALYNAHEVARHRLSLAHKHQKDYYDRTAHGLPYQVGDLVMYKTMPPLSACSKFYHPWDGPYVISKILNNASCKIRRVGEKKAKTS
ncbi:unnamed protein product [Hymenolepis diminuta]|uniref:Integrase catalytic domain-containing protein n=1 Tax=Hymenolepis diminuta TaxID=6216 RepID=A0A564YQV1_HYMDI|nr:unnamed protein product [Hymenolepis diminuta]